jgi:2-polyprenyl-3-methyl-5-hydroxy-6-metoxy-1,4-benzoquinol methylase
MVDQAAEGWLSPLLCRARIAAARPHLRGRVLDIGCGTGPLAAELSPERYQGMDVDPDVLAKARADFPGHSFTSTLPTTAEFDTVVALAVVEHVDEPGQFLARLTHCLRAGGQLVLTTPHPRGGRVHELAAALHLASRQAAHEHKIFLGRVDLVAMAMTTGLHLSFYRTFLSGLNQLAVLQRETSDPPVYRHHAQPLRARRRYR